MAAQALDPLSKLVTVFGGSGFLGRHVVRALAKRGYRIRVAVRRPDQGVSDLVQDGVADLVR